ncbi:MAG: DUF2442 domain-containing protein [Saprospiraceae bacterium]
METLDLPKINSAKFDGEYFIIYVEECEYRWNVSEISDRLVQASDKDRNDFKISPSGYGIHWQNLDEDLSLKGLLKSKNNSL